MQRLVKNNILNPKLTKQMTKFFSENSAKSSSQIFHEIYSKEIEKLQKQS